MFENCLFFKDSTLFEWWMDKVKLSTDEHNTIYSNIDFMKKFNGDINVFQQEYICDEGTEEEYNKLKKRLFNKLLCPNINSEDYELLLKKRATIHINELFDLYVDNNTLVITSAFEHISAEKAIKKCKNVINIDYEDNDSNIKYDLNKVFSEIKKYDKIFVYVIGTEFETGRRHSNSIYRKLYDELMNIGKKFTMVLDAVQEMFLSPRDYSFYHYIIGTSHSLYSEFDTGFLFINRNKVSDEEINHFSGYKRCDILKKFLDGLDIVLKRKDYIMMYRNIIDDSIDKDLFKGFNLHNSQSNFYSMYGQGNYLNNIDCFNYITKNFIEHSLTSDPGVNVEISYHKPYKELYIRLRPQTLMFDPNDVKNKLDYFYTHYKGLQRLILKQQIDN